MNKLISICWLSLLFILPLTANAAYERNVAMPVQKVEYAQVISMKNITETQLIEDQHQGWRTFGGAVLGGVIGHQFGGGSGQDVATVLGSLLGAGVANNYHANPQQIRTKLVELMLKTDDGQQLMVIQDYDPGMTFHAGDEVRVVYFDFGVRVDLAM